MAPSIGRRRLLANLSAAAVPALVGANALRPPLAWAIARQGASPVVLRFAPWGQWPGIGADWMKFIRPPLDAFQRQNPGILIEVVPPVSGGAALPQLLAGTAPDVFSEFDIVPYLEQHSLLVNLLPLLKRDNISTAIWSPGQMAQFYTTSGLWFLPNYLNVATIAVNLGDLDELGLSYPAADWSYEEAERLFRAATYEKNGIHHFGFSPVFRGIPYESAGPLPNSQYALEIFGGKVLDPSRTVCQLDDPRVVKAAEWWMGLFASGVATSAQSPLASPWRATFVENRNNYLLFDAEHWTRGYKWQFMPIPQYPAGRMSWVGSEGYAVNAATQNIDAAWTFMNFLVVDKQWQRYCMKTILQPPSLLSLWPEMNQIIEQTVPGFRGKGLHWYAISAAEWGRAVPAFKYNPTQVMATTNQVFSDMLRKRLGVAEGLQQLTRQINAIESAGRTAAGSSAASLVQIRRVPVATGSHYGPPPSRGVGVPAVQTPYVTVQNGTVTLLGDGTDCWNTSDNTIFACVPATATEGVWVCRIAAVTNLTCPHLSQWAKVGLMARGDLSDDAPAVFLQVTGRHGLEWAVRVEAGVRAVGKAALQPQRIGPRNLMAKTTPPGTQSLLRPVWLKLQRRGTTWTGWASYDGQQWGQVGGPLGCLMGACWVGVQACAHNISFGKRGYIRVAMDSLNFSPTHFLQIGSQGTPPAAGVVPPTWAEGAAASR